MPEANDIAACTVGKCKECGNFAAVGNNPLCLLCDYKRLLTENVLLKSVADATASRIAAWLEAMIAEEKKYVGINPDAILSPNKRRKVAALQDVLAGIERGDWKEKTDAE